MLQLMSSTGTPTGNQWLSRHSNASVALSRCCLVAPMKQDRQSCRLSSRLLLGLLVRCCTGKTGRRATSKCFRVAPLEGKGLGAVAIRDLRRGELVAADVPLLTFRADDLQWLEAVQDKFDKLSARKQGALMSLHDCKASAVGHKTMEGIIETNAFDCGCDDGIAIFQHLSRFNHSCTPNCEATWDPYTSQETIRASIDIACGHELCIGYTELRAPRSERLEALARCKNFRCCCPRCVVADGESDCRRIRLKELGAEIERHRAAVGPKQGITLVDEALGLLDEEGLHLHAYRRRLCNHAYLCARELGDDPEVDRWLDAAYDCSKVAHGENHWATLQIYEEIYRRRSPEISQRRTSEPSPWAPTTATIITLLVGAALAAATSYHQQ